jgi:hypothetical protein
MTALLLTANGHAAALDIEATTLKQFDLQQPPLDVDTSPDGKLMFILTPGQVLVYSNMGNEPVNRITVGSHFDSLTFAEDLDLLILSSKDDQRVKMVRIDLVSEISTEGSPVIGNPDAPVTLAVFDDYQ